MNLLRLQVTVRVLREVAAHLRAFGADASAYDTQLDRLQVRRRGWRADMQ